MQFNTSKDSFNENFCRDIIVWLRVVLIYLAGSIIWLSYVRYYSSCWGYNYE